jgi:hypothetical protein
MIIMILIKIFFILYDNYYDNKAPSPGGSASDRKKLFEEISREELSKLDILSTDGWITHEHPFLRRRQLSADEKKVKENMKS